jgi:hypothetical protein
MLLFCTCGCTYTLKCLKILSCVIVVTIDGVGLTTGFIGLHTVTVYYSVHTLQLTAVDHNTRLATTPQPVFHCTVPSRLSLFTRQGLGPPADPLALTGVFTNSELNSATTAATNLCNPLPALTNWQASKQ